MQRYSKIATKIIFSLFLTLGTTTNAEETFNTHGISAYGDLKYAPDYIHFEYVNQMHPKEEHLDYALQEEVLLLIASTIIS